MIAGIFLSPILPRMGLFSLGEQSVDLCRPVGQSRAPQTGRLLDVVFMIWRSVAEHSDASDLSAIVRYRTNCQDLAKGRHEYNGEQQGGDQKVS